MHANGSGCDYITEDVLQYAATAAGRIVVSHRSYKAILLAEVDSLHPQTVEALNNFVRTGGTVLLLGTVPERAPGLEAGTQSDTVASMMKQLLLQHIDRVALVKVDEDHLVNWYRDLQQRFRLTPDVAMSAPADFLSQVHYADDTRDLYFFANYSPTETHTFTAAFSGSRGRNAWLWDATSGSRLRYRHTSGDALRLTLAPSESKLVVFDSADASRAGDRLSSPAPDPTDFAGAQARPLPGPWRIELASVTGVRTSQVVENLTDPSLINALHDFAGTIIYRSDFKLKRSTRRCWIDIGPLPHGVSELRVNDEPLGVRWYGNNHVYTVKSALQPGHNTCEIRVTTTLGNYAKTLTGNRTAEIWTANTPFYPAGLCGPVHLLQL